MKQVNERVDGFLPSIVSKLETYLGVPHMAVVTQGDVAELESQSFYYVGKGTCKVSVRDAKGKESEVRRLKKGDHFGEV